MRIKSLIRLRAYTIFSFQLVFLNIDMDRIDDTLFYLDGILLGFVYLEKTECYFYKEEENGTICR